MRELQHPNSRGTRSPMAKEFCPGALQLALVPQSDGKENTSSKRETNLHPNLFEIFTKSKITLELRSSYNPNLDRLTNGLCRHLLTSCPSGLGRTERPPPQSRPARRRCSLQGTLGSARLGRCWCSGCAQRQRCVVFFFQAEDGIRD